MNVITPLYNVLFRGSINWTTWCDLWPTALWGIDFLLWTVEIVVSYWAEIDNIIGFNSNNNPIAGSNKLCDYK